MVISIESIFRTGKNYYPHVLLGQCKYVIKEKKRIHNYITDNLEISSNSDEEIFDKIQMKKNSDEEDSSKEEDSHENKSYQKLPPDYRRNYYLAHKKQLSGLLKILGQSRLLKG